MSTLGEAVREGRIRKGLTQARLARLAGVSRRHLAALEKGANVSINVLKKVAGVLELRQIELGDMSLHSGNNDRLNLPMITDAIREAKADVLKTQAMLSRAEGLLGIKQPAGSGNGTEVGLAFPIMPVRRLDAPYGDSADMIRDRPDWKDVRTAGVIRQGETLDEKEAETIQLPDSLLEEGEIVFRARGTNLRDQGIEDGDLLIVELRPRGRAANGEIVIGKIGKLTYVGRWWQKHGQKALMSNGLSEVTVGKSARSLKVVAVVNQIVRFPLG